MNKALVTILVIVLVAGVFIEEGNAVLRAGRDQIENLERRFEERRAARKRGGKPFCYTGGKSDIPYLDAKETSVQYKNDKK